MAIGETPWTSLQNPKRAAEKNRKEVAQQRLTWHECQKSVDPERPVFFNETGLKTDVNWIRGWAETGRHLVVPVVAGQREMNPLIYAIALDGTRTAMILDEPVDGIRFAGFCEFFLIPTLRPGDLVVLDNRSSHKSTGANRSIESVGSRLVFLPSIRQI